jgi:eukaryotic-like serine/threonine-protein kinase
MVHLYSPIDMPEPNSNPDSQPPSSPFGADHDQPQVPDIQDLENRALNSGFLNETRFFEVEQSTDATTAFDSKTKAVKNPAVDSKTSPRKIGGYELGSLLGQGGMGRVYHAGDSSGGSVALKLLSPNLASSPEALARFKQEGLIASQINHPHIVFVHRVDEEDGIPFIAMELMTGKTLKDLVVDSGPQNYDTAVRLILQCIDGLIEAHARGMIHRDIKPANCYLDEEGNVKVGDFGLARSLISDSELTQTGAFLGTPLYASPEQLLGQKIDNRSDIYSLSATLYYLLAGRAPFESPNAAQVIARIASSDPPSFQSAEVEVPPALEEIVMKGLARDAAKRYQSFAEMRDDLLRLLAPKPERASFLRRIVAGIADWFIISTAVGLLAFTLLPTLAQQQLLAELVSIPFVLIYYLVFEFGLGTSPGKGALHIQVIDIRTGIKPTIWRCLHRSLAYLLVTSGASVAAILTIMLLDIKHLMLIVSLQWLGAILGYILCLFGWFYFKERLMFFDWLSGTACQITPAIQVPFTHLELPAWEPNPKDSPDAVPACFGRFRINHELEPLTGRPEIRWFEGVDPQLERTVWVILSSNPSLELEEIQRAKPKWNRIRFIEEGRHEQGRWFAYVAAEGMPLEQCLSSGVQLSWPQTKSVMGQVATLLDASRQANQAPPSRSSIWIDRAGRLSVVDFETTADHSSWTLLQSDTSSPSESSQHHDLVRTVCSLALSPHHKYRRKRLSQKARASALPVQVLMPLRARKLCESLAAEKWAMPMEEVIHDFQQASSGPAFVSTKSRFFSSTLSTAFLIPVMVAVWFMLIAPSLIYYGNLMKAMQSVKTLQLMTQREGLDKENWEGATAEQQAFCLSPAGKIKINKLVETMDQRMKASFENLGVIERTIFKQIPVFGPSPTEPLPFRLKGDLVPESKNSTQSRQFDGGGFIRIGRKNYSLIEDAAWSPNDLRRGLKFVEGDLNEVVKFEAAYELEQFPVSFIWWMLAGCVAWTWLTFGGISQYLTGICFVKRDGQKIGFIRSAIRAILLYLPIMALVYLIAYWPLVDENDIFWTTQLKRLLGVAPLIYLASTLLKSNRTPLDTLTGTAAVPR